jgi:hypothetical protein
MFQFLRGIIVIAVMLLSFPPVWNILGLVLALTGILVLFRYGMPFHVPTAGHRRLLLHELDPKDIVLEQRYKIHGYFGLGLIVAGTAAQIWASILEIMLQKN